VPRLWPAALAIEPQNLYDAANESKNDFFFSKIRTNFCRYNRAVGRRRNLAEGGKVTSTSLPVPPSATHPDHNRWDWDSCCCCCCYLENEKALGETQTLCADCSKAEPKNFAPPQTLSGGAARSKFNQLEKVTHYLYLQTQFGEDRCTQFRVIVVTDPQTHTHTHTYNAQPHKPWDMTDHNTLR